MSRKFSIVATIDLGKIDNEIKEYKMLHLYNEEPYIFMSEDTARAIESEVGINDIIIDNETLANKIKNTKGGVYATYTGYKVFINNDLKFGIVEVR